ncbi:MAG: alpha/beta hydrolase [Deltaproteobacteria bacterium]|nr:alpha/beta hydrolase [Deltaproteobacteria bacterium]
MPETNTYDYSFMDRPEVLRGLFYPRPEYGPREKSDSALDMLIPVENDIMVGGRFHIKGKSSPNILFFHGNGEIAADYNDLGPLFTHIGINFLVVDYRGYGRSAGTPTATNMMKDCRTIFRFTMEWLEKNDCKGAFLVMGRSLGSASAVDLANYHKDLVDGLIIESGFAFTGPLLKLLGANKSAAGFREKDGFGNLEKIKTWDKPTLIIHAEFDHIIPFSDGQSLYDVCTATDKKLLKIPGANHNDIFIRGIDRYMEAVKTLCEKFE